MKKPATRTAPARVVTDRVQPAPPRSATIQLRYWLLLAILLTPLVYSRHRFFGYITERSWYLSACIELLGIVSLISPGFFQRPLSALQRALLLFLAVMGLADAFGVDPIQSFYSGFSRMDGYWLLLHLGLLALVLARTPFSPQQWNRALAFSVLVATGVVLWGMASPWGWQAADHRLIASVGNPAFLAGYLLIHLLLIPVLVRRFTTPSRTARLGLALPVALVLGLGLYLTGTRSAVLALALAGTVQLGLLTWQRTARRALRVSVAVGVPILLAGVFWLTRSVVWLQQQPVLYRLTHFSDHYDTFRPRWLCWQLAWEAIQQRPVLGWGQENFSYGFAQFFNPDLMSNGTDDWYDRAHNGLLDLTFSAGFLGLAAYLWLWFCLIQTLLRKPGLSGRMELLGVLIAYATFNLLNFDSLLPLLSFFVLIGGIDGLSQPAAAGSPDRPRAGLAVIRLTGLVILLALSWVSVYQPFSLLRALDHQNTLPTLSQRVVALESAYHRAGGRQLDLADCLVSLALSALASPDIPADQQQLAYERASTLMTEQLGQHPSFSRLMARLATLHLAGRQPDRAIALCHRMLSLEHRRRPATFLQLGNAYLSRKAYSDAMVAYANARRLQPSWDRPVLNQAMVCATLGDTVQCYTLLRKLPPATLNQQYSLVRQLFAGTGHAHGYLDLLARLPRRDLIAPALYTDWALTGFDLRDYNQMTMALNCYFNMYLHQQHTLAEISHLIEAGKRGTRPDVLTAMTEQLTP
ncbi:hypothetical protein GCM10027578_36870 [Spirosoma luteolum]